MFIFVATDLNIVAWEASCPFHRNHEKAEDHKDATWFHYQTTNIIPHQIAVISRGWE